MNTPKLPQDPSCLGRLFLDETASKLKWEFSGTSSITPVTSKVFVPVVRILPIGSEFPKYLAAIFSVNIIFFLDGLVFW